MKVIIGLGNPGKEYEATRHNVGFQCVDRVREKLGFPEFKLQKKFYAETTEGIFSDEKFLLAKPQTFMNASGKSVAALVHFYHIAPKDLWLIYDDVDLPLGKIRMRPNGSAGSHNGMKSVIKILGFQNFPRIRIGIESRDAGGSTASPDAAAKQQDISSFVLNAFSKKEKMQAAKTVENAANALLYTLQNGLEKAMEKYN